MSKIEKKFIEVTPDGKVEIEEGREPLDKQPQPAAEAEAQAAYQDAQADADELERKKKKKVKKTLKEVWNLLKAEIDHNKAIMSIGDEDEDEQESQEDNEQPEELSDEEHQLLASLAGEDGEGSQEEGQEKEVDQLEGGLADGRQSSEFDPEQIKMGQEVEMEHTNDPDKALEIAKDHLAEDPEYYSKLKVMESEGEEGNQDDVPEDVAAIAEQEGIQPEQLTDEELEDIMQQLGYSDAEIAHVVHAHAAPTVDPVDQSKIDASNAKLEDSRAAAQMDRDNKTRSSDADHEHKLKMNQLEQEHAQRMKDLEQQLKQKEIEVNDPEMERDHKKRMLDIDAKLKELELTAQKNKQDIELQFMIKEKELELENKKKEADLKLKIKLQQLKDKAAQKEAETSSEEIKKSQDSKELKLGIKIEAEHSDTLKKLIKDVKVGKVKPFKYYFKDIAEDHLDELKDYYTRLTAMENKADKKDE